MFKLDGEKKRLVSNFFSLSVLQGANYILPLITFPYLVRVLGPEKFGLISFAQAFIQYFNVLTDYGFNLSATREISINRDNPKKVSEIFSSVMIIKFGLLLLSLVILSIIVFAFDKFRQDWIVYYLTFGIVVGQALFPVWFFQGMEEMKYISFLNLLNKSLALFFIYFWVRNSTDYLYVSLIYSIFAIITGLCSLLICMFKFKVSFYFIKSYDVVKRLKSGLHIFLSSISINIYKSSGVFILGLFTNNIITGFFAIAKKLMDSINAIASIISQTIYPNITRNLHVKTQKTVRFIKLTGIVIAVYTFIIGLVLFFGSRTLVTILTGNMQEEIVVSIKILAFVPFIIGVNVPAVQMLLSKKQDKYFLKSVMTGGIVNILLNIILIPIWSYVGACISVVISELIVTISLYVYNFSYNRYETK